MLRGQNITLRTVRQSDPDTLYAHLSDVANRGDYLPHNVQSEPDYRKAVQETGLWAEQRGTLLIVNDAGDILGSVVFFTTVPYMDEYELGYLIFDPQQGGKGIATEALNLLAHYLFDSRKVNRLRLVTHPDNKASRRVAEKCGFTQESTAPGSLVPQREEPRRNHICSPSRRSSRAGVTPRTRGETEWPHCAAA